MLEIVTHLSKLTNALEVPNYLSRTPEKIEASRDSALLRYTGSVDPNQFVSYHWHTRQTSTRPHSRRRQTMFIFLGRNFERLSAPSQSEVRATFEGPILESSHSSQPLGGESVFATLDNKSSTSRFLSRQQLPVS